MRIGHVHAVQHGIHLQPVEGARDAGKFGKTHSVYKRQGDVPNGLNILTGTKTWIRWQKRLRLIYMKWKKQMFFKNKAGCDYVFKS